MNKQLATKTGGFSPLLIIPFVILLLFYLPTLYELVMDWATDCNYSHGFLIPLVSVYLICQKKKELSGLTFTTDNRGLFFVAAGLILFILGNGAAEYFTVRFSFLVILFGMVYYLFGHQLVRKTWFEFFFLLFMIPIP